MTAPLSSPETTPSDDPTSDAPGDWSRPVMERQLAILGRLAEAGLNIALAIERQATQAGGAPLDAGLAYDRVARAVRLTIALQSKLIEAIKAMERPAPIAPGQRRDAVRRILGRVVRAEHDSERVIAHLNHQLRERTEHDDIYGDLDTLPLSEIIARICKDLGLSPDWPRLAQEAWAQAEIDGGHPGSPLAALTAGRGPPHRPRATPATGRPSPQAASP